MISFLLVKPGVVPPWLFVDVSMSYKSYIRGGDTLAESKVKTRALRHVSGKLDNGKSK